MPDDRAIAPTAARDYERIARAIGYVAGSAARRPSLEEIAAAVHTSPFHLQRLFTRWAGVSPAQFLRALTLAHAREALAAAPSILDAAYDAGLSGPGRLHDLFVALDGVTPGEAKALGAGLTIRWGVHESPFGAFIAGTTTRGLCALEFLAPGAGEAEARALLRERWQAATLVRDPAATEAACAPLSLPGTFDARQPIRVWARGTNFQLQVWRALLRLPEGALASYADIAAAVGRPRAVRAVASAIAANPVAWLIPCHRVIRSTGAVATPYRWGTPRKLALVGWEQARRQPAASPSTSCME